MNKTFDCLQELKARELLKDEGLKSTPQRLAVVHVLHTSAKYLSINEILDGVREHLPNTGLATIYRTLETYVELGLVKRVHFPDGCHSYTISPAHHSHQMVCIKCNSVFNFSTCPIENLGNVVANQNGFKVKNHFVQLFGECRDCQ